VAREVGDGAVYDLALVPVSGSDIISTGISFT
jgi:hypothetical protein